MKLNNNDGLSSSGRRNFLLNCSVVSLSSVVCGGFALAQSDTADALRPENSARSIPDASHAKILLSQMSAPGSNPETKSLSFSEVLSTAESCKFDGVELTASAVLAEFHSAGAIVEACAKHKSSTMAIQIDGDSDRSQGIEGYSASVSLWRGVIEKLGIRCVSLQFPAAKDSSHAFATTERILPLIESLASIPTVEVVLLENPTLGSGLDVRRWTACPVLAATHASKVKLLVNSGGIKYRFDWAMKDVLGSLSSPTIVKGIRASLPNSMSPNPEAREFEREVYTRAIREAKQIMEADSYLILQLPNNPKYVASDRIQKCSIVLRRFEKEVQSK